MLGSEDGERFCTHHIKNLLRHLSTYIPISTIVRAWREEAALDTLLNNLQRGTVWRFLNGKAMSALLLVV